ncbi:MAG TPA: PIN domain-containing protein [Leptospiraceae bacterium]|nr:PIN domain-containing protein [Leptospiraceae bacterium]HRG75363.1 PIN domain-containing protein [Leptospiraceae bacterium]
MITLIDTSAWIEALRVKGNEEIRGKVKEFLVSGDARIAEPILLELFHGARGKKELDTIKDLSDTVPILKCNEKVFEEAYKNGMELRTKGLTVPAMDILIYTISIFYKTKIYHNDSDFTSMHEILKK